MQEETVEGIVLRSQDYKEKQRIITLFTPLGLLGVVVKGITSKKAERLVLTTLFTHGEYHLVRKNSELFSFRDGVILNAHLPLRQRWHSLQNAGALAQGILRSQWPGRASERVFALYKAYHQQVGEWEQGRALIASFYIKLLQLEGVLLLSGEEEPTEFQGLFSSAERETMLQLGEVKLFSLMRNISVSEPLLGKIEKLLDIL